MTRFRRPRRLLLAAFVATVALPTLPALADSTVVQSWRGDDGWLTELRRHDDGALVCTTAKGFSGSHAFGLSLVRSGSDTVIVLVDERQPPTSGGTLAFSQGGESLGSLAATVQGPAWATAESDSAAAEAILSRLDDGTLTIAVAGRSYEADLAGVGPALRRLGACMEQAAKS